MTLFAIAGGSGLVAEDMLGCCGLCPVLPLVVVLAGRAVRRDSAGAACLAVLAAGLPYLLLALIVGGYGPSDDGDVLDDQARGREAAGWYAALTAVAGLSAAWVLARRLMRWFTS